MVWTHVQQLKATMYACAYIFAKTVGGNQVAPVNYFKEYNVKKLE